MHFKPLIAVNTDFRSARKDAPAYIYLAARYLECLEEAGAIPLVLPPLKHAADLAGVLDRIDGVLMIGGQDLDPRRDGFMLHPSIRCMEPRREDFDRMLIRMVAARRLPVFGIGAGMQLLNVAQGGTLSLHIPEDMPQALPHRDPQDPAHRHGLTVTKGSLMERVFGDGEIRVNSMHHMAVDDVAPGFAVTARCPDGVIEAIESKQEDWLALGTQFHPEAESASAMDQRIFEEFVQGVMERASTRLVA